MRYLAGQWKSVERWHLRVVWCMTCMIAMGLVAFSAAPLANAPSAVFDFGFGTPSIGDAAEWVLAAQAPRRLHIPEMTVRMDPAPQEGVILWVFRSPLDDGSPGEWVKVDLAAGAGPLPLQVSTVSDLEALRFKIQGSGAEMAAGARLTLIPSQALVLNGFEAGKAAPAGVTVTNWGETQALRVKAVDLLGRSVALRTADASQGCWLGRDGWYDLGVLPAGSEQDLLVAEGQEVRDPVSIIVEDEAGVATYGWVVCGSPTLPVDQATLYYGMTPSAQWICLDNSRVTNATELVITAIWAPTSYTLINITDGTTFATGTISSKGAKSTISSLTDGKAWKLATSKPVQAYMDYDWNGNLPGAMFYLGDDGMLSLGQAQALIENAVDECDRFYPAFQFVLWGNKSPADALEAAMIDAVGEA